MARQESILDHNFRVVARHSRGIGGSSITLPILQRWSSSVDLGVQLSVW